MDLPSLLRRLLPPLQRPYEVDFIAACSEFDREVELARAAGMLLEPAQFRPESPLPDDLNAATYLSEFARIAAAHPDLVATAGKPSDLGAFAKAACDREDAVAAAWQASVSKGCDFGWDWERCFEIDFGELREAGNAAKVLGATARVLASEGGFQDAHRMIAACLRIGDLFRDHPVLIGHLVRIACESVALRSLSALAMAMPEPAMQISELRMVAGEIHGQNLAEALRGEGVFSFALAARRTPPIPRSSGNPRIDRMAESEPLPDNPDWYRGVAARSLARTRTIYEAVAAAGPDAWDQSLAGQRAFSEQSKDRRAASVAGRSRGPLMPLAFDSFVHRDLMVRLTSLFADLLEHRHRNGSFPGSLPDWGEVTRDPFSPGSRFGYRREGDGFAVWSAGRGGAVAPSVLPDRFGLGQIGRGGTIGLRFVPARAANL